jgi:hypothetical protein
MPKGQYKRTKPTVQGSKIKAGKNMNAQYIKAATICQMAGDGLEDVIAGMADSSEITSTDAPGLLIGLIAHLKEAARLLTERKV